MISGQYPVNPLTIRYINEQLTAEGHRPDGTVQPLTVMDLEELEGCQALLQRKGRTLPQLLDAWRASPYRDAAFRNYLAHEIGGQELGTAGRRTGRPGGIIRSHPAAARHPGRLDTTGAGRTVASRPRAGRPASRRVSVPGTTAPCGRDHGGRRRIRRPRAPSPAMAALVPASRRGTYRRMLPAISAKRQTLPATARPGPWASGRVRVDGSGGVLSVT